MGVCSIHNYNFNKIKWNSGHMLKWLCMNDGRQSGTYEIKTPAKQMMIVVQYIVWCIVLQCLKFEALRLCGDAGVARLNEVVREKAGWSYSWGVGVYRLTLYLLVVRVLCTMLVRLWSAYEFLRSDEVIDRVEFIKWASTAQHDNGLLIAILERLDEIRREGDVDEVLTRRELRTDQKKHGDTGHYMRKSLCGMIVQLVRDLVADLFGCGRQQNFHDFQWGKLDPVRFVRVYALLKQLENHVYNIHEASCLEQSSKPRLLSRFLFSQSQRDEAELDEEKKRDDAMMDWTKLNVFLSIMAFSTQIVFIVFIIDELVNELNERFDESGVKHIISNTVIAVATISLFMGFVLENYVSA